MDTGADRSEIEVVERAEEILRTYGSTWHVRWRRVMRSLCWTTDVYVVGFVSR